MKYSGLQTSLMSVFLVAALLLPQQACMMIADKDLIKIAKVDGEYITRGDLARILRDMEDTERPNIRNKLDLIRVLDAVIDEQITLPLGKQLATEGKIAVSRDQARERYFASKGDEADSWRHIYNFNSEDTTALMNVYQLTPETLRARKDVIELKTDEIVERMQAQEAVAYLAAQDFRSGALQPNEETVKQEYELRKHEFINFEWMSFRAFRFPTAQPEAIQQAAEVHRRLQAGESWEQLEVEYLAKNPNFIIESEIENNPAATKFQGFWQAASGALPGEILGPVFLPEYQVLAAGADGRPQPVTMPESYIVLKVLENRGETIKSLEESRNIIVPQVLIAQEMEKLRQEHGVEIYEENLNDPGQFMTKDNPLNF